MRHYVVINMYLYSDTMTSDLYIFFFFSSRRRHTRFDCDWSSDVCSSDLTLASGATVSDEEFDFLRADGTRGSLSVSSAPISDRTGEIVAAVATFWDISDRKRMEATLRESEQRFRLLLENTADYAIFMIDDQGRISTWNSGAERLLGWSESEVV